MLQFHTYLVTSKTVLFEVVCFLSSFLILQFRLLCFLFLFLKTVPHWEISRELIMRALRGMIQCTRHCSIYVFFNCLILAMASCLPRKAGGIPLSAFPKDTTSELAGFVSTLSLFNAERQAGKL